jgi:hypothetical protein
LRLHLEQGRLPEPCADGDREAAGGKGSLAGAGYPSFGLGRLSSCKYLSRRRCLEPAGTFSRWPDELRGIHQ